MYNQISTGPIAVTQQEAITLLRSQKLFRRAVKAGWIKPIVQGGLGKQSIFRYTDVAGLLDRFADELPPLLPSEQRALERRAK